MNQLDQLTARIAHHAGEAPTRVGNDGSPCRYDRRLGRIHVIDGYRQVRQAGTYHVALGLFWGWIAGEGEQL
jgi:hypothetical protein